VVPASSATKIVAAERDVPGNTPATTWAIPTRLAVVHDTSRRSPSACARRAASCSATSIHNAPITSAHATGRIVVGSSQPSFLTSSPSTAVIANATPSFKA